MKIRVRKLFYRQNGSDYIRYRYMLNGKDLNASEIREIKDRQFIFHEKLNDVDIKKVKEKWR